jgi:transporter family protein
VKALSATMQSWVIYALLALVAFGTLNFVLKLVTGKVTLSLLLVLFFSTALVISLALFVKEGMPLELTKINLTYIIIAGALYTIGLFALITSLGTGMGSKVIPIVNLNTVLAVVLFILFLGEKLTLKTTTGVVLAVVSIYLLTA